MKRRDDTEEITPELKPLITIIMITIIAVFPSMLLLDILMN